MSSEYHEEFSFLDVGPGNKPRGNVNIGLFRSVTYPKKMAENFVIADVAFLPFKDDAFAVAFSTFKIEQVNEPFLMLKEMCRVAKRKTIVRYFYRLGNGARAPNQIQRFDEKWFQNAAATLGFESVQFANGTDYPVSGKILKIFPKNIQKIRAWGILRRFERWSRRIRKVPVEMEVWIKKGKRRFDSDEAKFVVVYNIPEVFKNCFSSSTFVSPDKVIAYYNVKNESLPKFYNDTVRKHRAEETWFIFCHQDFIVQEDLRLRLKEKDTKAVYGPIGVRLGMDHFLGEIIQGNNEPLGARLIKDEVVQTLDAQCIIAHASVFRQGLRFDERFRFHFYDADFCMQAYTKGFDVFATQIDCQHKSRTLTGDLTSQEYIASLADFKEKWKLFLPIKTSTTTVDEKSDKKV
jgi:hypothetical protein